MTTSQRKLYRRERIVIKLMHTMRLDIIIKGLNWNFALYQLLLTRYTTTRTGFRAYLIQLSIRITLREGGYNSIESEIKGKNMVTHVNII